MAAELRLPVTLLHVLEPPAPPVPAGAAAVAWARETWTREARGSARRMLDRLGDELPGTPAVRVLDGPAGRALARAAADLDAVMLAIGASARGPLAAAVLGSASRDLRRHAGIPVLICPDRERA